MIIFKKIVMKSIFMASTVEKGNKYNFLDAHEKMI